MKHEPFVIERVLNAPVEKVWKAITDKDQMKQWYFDIPDFRAEEGNEFSFEGQDHEGNTFIHLCEVTEVVPLKKLRHSWRYQGYPGNTFVTWELIAEGDRTRVRLSHEGLETFPAGIKAFAKENFVQGWTDIVGTNLPEFVEEGTIQKSVEINAPAERVWDVLTGSDYTSQWGNAFSEGAHVETDWNYKSEVVWKDKDGNVGAKGIVDAISPASMLRVVYFDDITSTVDSAPGKYTETCRLSARDGKTELSFEAGPLALKYLKQHEPLWEKALEKMKELAEN